MNTTERAFINLAGVFSFRQDQRGRAQLCLAKRRSTSLIAF
jgi:hypothetical protein